MSHGCGTLASPGAFATGTAKASSSNGKQHTLPKNAYHELIDAEKIEAHWGSKQPQGPTRLWGTTKPTKFGGEERVDGEPEQWLKGEYWNVDSNIRVWGPHEVKRNAAAANHDVHRHDQITRIVLPPQPGHGKQVSRQCISGVVGADTCFLEAWGFDLGLRDRQANPATLWRPANSDEMFRAERSYNRNLSRMAENFRTLRKSHSEVITLRPEDVGGESGDVSTWEDGRLDTMGRTHGSRSCRFWDRYNHSVRREASKMACGVHAPAFRSHPQAHPMKDHHELSPASVYTLRYRKFGEDGLRKHVTASTKAGRTTARMAAGRATLSSTL